MKLFVSVIAALLIAGPLVAKPDDLATKFESLKQAETKKDLPEIKKLAVEICTLTHETLKSTPASDEEKQRVEQARTIQTHAEYALFSAAVQAPPANALDLLSTLEQQNPKSKYFDDGYSTYFVALQQTGASDKIPDVADRALQNFPEHEDALLILADNAFNRKQTDRSGRYAERLIVVMEKHAKPDGVAAAAWERKRSSALGRARWIAGLAHMEKTHYPDANRDLRASLPLITENEAMLAAALFNLGVANYQIGKLTLNKKLVLEAAQFSEQAGKMNSPLAVQARHNALVMRNDAIKMR